jgi:hypothetical protein
MDLSEANVDLWIKRILFLRSGLLVVVFPCVTETLWLVWPCWAGAAAPGGSTGPDDVVVLVSLPWPIASVVYSLDPT